MCKEGNNIHTHKHTHTHTHTLLSLCSNQDTCNVYEMCKKVKLTTKIKKLIIIINNNNNKREREEVREGLSKDLHRETEQE